MGAAMTDLEKVGLALRRAAARYRCAGTHDFDLIGDAFATLADEVSKIPVLRCIEDHEGQP